MSEPDGAARARALDRLPARSRSLRRLLDQLLGCALVVQRTDSAPRAPIDQREVALEIIERDDHVHLHSDVDLRLEIGEEPVMVRVDALSLGEAALNLLVKHCATVRRHPMIRLAPLLDAGAVPRSRFALLNVLRVSMPWRPVVRPGLSSLSPMGAF